MQSARLTEESFAEVIARTSGVLLVHFELGGFAPSARVREVLARLQDSRADLTVAEIDVEAWPSLCQLCSIDLLPAVLFFRNGVEIGRLLGCHPTLHYTLAAESTGLAPAGAELVRTW